jgi:hypothetical protein
MVILANGWKRSSGHSEKLLSYDMDSQSRQRHNMKLLDGLSGS